MYSYGAITIGPIIETISNVSTPGALWCASSLFSDITRYLCKSIIEGIDGVEIVSPAYDESNDVADGIGKWHDRIHFKCTLETEVLKDKLKEIVAETKRYVSEKICEAIGGNIEEVSKYINRYIQINYLVAADNIAEANGKNCILNLRQYLDSAELSAGFTHDETNSPLSTLLNGISGAPNHFIKGCWLVPSGRNAQIFKEGNIKDIEHIANPDDAPLTKKYRSYYAIVQSDGDGIGNCLEGCPTNEKVKEFSKTCIGYTKDAAKLIGDYGGMTVYAGGDDLLFLAPLAGNNGKDTILTLCKNISKKFEERFKTLNANCGCPMPTLSFGISVNYVSAPLYEAVNDVLGLLQDAKKEVEHEKRRIALALHKHSGQTEKFIAFNCWDEKEPLSKLDDLLKTNIEATDSEEDKILQSVLYLISNFKPLYNLCRKNGLDTKNFFDNTFDNGGQTANRAYIDRIKELGDSIHLSGRCVAAEFVVDGNGKNTDDEPDVLNAFLRFAKLYSEEGGKASGKLSD